jgi:hypothetical protein
MSFAILPVGGAKEVLVPKNGAIGAFHDGPCKDKLVQSPEKWPFAAKSGNSVANFAARSSSSQGAGHLVVF